jgi:predicted regulator of Ras-like GTPase activity (Roadblock/LC7/MglB family)
VSNFEEILSAMNEAGGFVVSVLTSLEGLPIATVPADYSSDLAAAMVALLQRASSDAQGQLGMAEVDEVTIRDCQRVRLVCRYFTVEKERLILAAMVPPGRYYRQATNRAIEQIKRLLSCQ